MFRSTPIHLPLVGRELRILAKTKSIYWTRTLVAVILTFIYFIAGLASMSDSFSGTAFYGVMTCLVFYFLLFLTPLITAGCITTEKEGATLGLLFLSSFTSVDIVMGKFTSYFLRLSIIFLAAMPIFMGCLMLGGITWNLVLGTVFLITSMLVLSVAVCVFTSSISSKTQISVLLAYSYIFLLNFGFWILNSVLESNAIHPPFDLLVFSPAHAMIQQFDWNQQASFLSRTTQVMIIAWVQTLLLLAAAAWRLPKTVARSESESGLKRAIRRFERRFAHLNMAGKLSDRDPLYWLEKKRVSMINRITSLGILATGLILIFVFDSQLQSNSDIGSIMSIGWFFQILIAIYAIGAMIREVIQERKNRSFELLLCTPYQDKAIVHAKLKGAWLRYGTPYIAISFPLCIISFWNPEFLQFNNGPTGVPLLDFGHFFGIILDFLEDFFLMTMIFGIALQTGFSSKTATGATIMAIFISLAIFAASGIWTGILFAICQLTDFRSFSLVIMAGGKILIELLFCFAFIETSRNRLRRQFSMTEG